MGPARSFVKHILALILISIVPGIAPTENTGRSKKTNMCMLVTEAKALLEGKYM
jgi:hypothetical protein